MDTHPSPRPIRHAVAAAALAALAGQAPAQTAPAAGDDPIVITATRRREPVREVPVQVDVLTVEQLERSGARTLTDYLADRPGIDVKSNGAGFGQVNIRGVSTGDNVSRAVGIYIDDVAFGSSTAYALGSTTALDLNLLDLNHIEVLRGPQGTLYGAGSIGGLLKYVTNEPSTTAFSARANVAAQTTRHGGIGNTESAVVNVPLKQDVAGLRVSALHDHVGGYIDGVGPAAGSNINRGTTLGARVALQIEPTSALRVRLSGTTQRIRRDAQDSLDYDPATGRPTQGDLKRLHAVDEPYEIKVALGALEVEYDFRWARLDAISSAQYSKLENRNDFTAVYGPLLAGAGLVFDKLPFDGRADVHKQSQELRLTSQSGGMFEWLAGLYYTHEKANNGQLVTSFFADGSAGPVLADASLPSRYIETAAYGDLTWNPLPRLSVTGGLRYARNRQTFEQNTDGPLFGGATSLDGSSKDTSRTYLGTVRYGVTATSNVYARYATGYRPGGPNVVINDPVTGQPRAPTTFDPDTLHSYEVGYKADLLDRTLSIESALYTIRWKDIQQASAVNGVGVLVNGGRARIDGAELALRWKPLQSLQLGASTAWINARLTEDAPGLGQDGARLPNSARWSGTFSADYRFRVFDRGAYAGVTERLVGRRNAGYDTSATLPNYRLPGYALTDLQAGVELDRYQVGLYARNIFDRRAQLSAATNEVPLGGPALVTPTQPRTFGITASATF